MTVRDFRMFLKSFLIKKIKIKLENHKVLFYQGRTMWVLLKISKYCRSYKAKLF